MLERCAFGSEGEVEGSAIVGGVGSELLGNVCASTSPPRPEGRRVGEVRLAGNGDPGDGRSSANHGDLPERRGDGVMDDGHFCLLGRIHDALHSATIVTKKNHPFAVASPRTTVTAASVTRMGRRTGFTGLTTAAVQWGRRLAGAGATPMLAPRGPARRRALRQLLRPAGDPLEPRPRRRGPWRPS